MFSDEHKYDFLQDENHEVVVTPGYVLSQFAEDGTDLPFEYSADFFPTELDYVDFEKGRYEFEMPSGKGRFSFGKWIVHMVTRDSLSLKTQTDLGIALNPYSKTVDETYHYVGAHTGYYTHYDPLKILI